MKIAYFSLTGQTNRFVNKLNMECIKLDSNNFLYQMNDDFILITPTYDDNMTDFIKSFIEFSDNITYLKGIVASGNRNFATEFALTGKKLSKLYDIPLLMEFEFSGTDEDVDTLKKEVQKIENSTNS